MLGGLKGKEESRGELDRMLTDSYASALVCVFSFIITPWLSYCTQIASISNVTHVHHLCSAKSFDESKLANVHVKPLSSVAMADIRLWSAHSAIREVLSALLCSRRPRYLRRSTPPRTNSNLRNDMFLVSFVCSSSVRDLYDDSV